MISPKNPLNCRLRFLSGLNLLKKLSIFLSLFLIVGHLAAIVPSNVIQIAFGIGIDVDKDFDCEEDSNEAEDNDTNEKEKEQNENEFFKEYLITSPQTALSIASSKLWELEYDLKISGPAIDLSFPPPER